MAPPPINVAMPWHSLGHGNLGVDALTRANIAIVNAAAVRIGRDVRITTLGTVGAPDAAALFANVTVGERPRLKPIVTGRSELIRVLRASDLVLDIGEGDSWTDIYGTQRFVFHAGTKIATLALGKPLVLSPQTIGPFDHPVKRRIADAIMNRARAVFTRDSLSTAYVAQRRLRCETAEYIDVAFRLPFTPQPRAAARARVGLNVSGLLYRGGYTGRNELGLTIDYRDFTHRLMAALRDRGAELHLVPHVTAPDGSDDDRSVIPALRERFPDLIVPDAFPDASTAKSYMSGLDFVVGGRMHACIGAFSAGTPVVPIAYSRKFNGLFDTLGYPHYVDGKAVSTDEAVARTLAGFDRRAQLAEDIRPGLALAKDRLDAYEARLADILASVGGGTAAR